MLTILALMILGWAIYKGIRFTKEISRYIKQQTKIYIVRKRRNAKRLAVAVVTAIKNGLVEAVMTAYFGIIGKIDAR